MFGFSLRPSLYTALASATQLTPGAVRELRRAGGGSPAGSAPLLPRRLTTAAITTATTRATPRPATATIDHRMRRFWCLGVTAAKQFRLDWLALRSRRCVRVRLGHACGAPVATGAPLFWHASDRRRLDRHQERRSHVVVA